VTGPWALDIALVNAINNTTTLFYLSTEATLLLITILIAYLNMYAISNLLFIPYIVPYLVFETLLIILITTCYKSYRVTLPWFALLAKEASHVTGHRRVNAINNTTTFILSHHGSDLAAADHDLLIAVF